MPGTTRAAVVGQEVNLSGGNVTLVVVVAAIAVLALVMGFVFRRQVLAAGEGTENMQTIARAVQEGASAYLNRQFNTLKWFVLPVFLVLFLLPGDTGIRVGRSVFFVIGAVVVRADRVPRHVAGDPGQHPGRGGGARGSA